MKNLIYLYNLNFLQYCNIKFAILLVSGSRAAPVHDYGLGDERAKNQTRHRHLSGDDDDDDDDDHLSGDDDDDDDDHLSGRS